MPYIRKYAKPEIVNFLDDKRKTKVIVFDLETNGLDKEYSVLSCSAIKYEITPETYEMTELDRFDRYYYPIEEENPYAIAVNGLTLYVIMGKRGNADYPKYFNQDSGFEKFCNGVQRFVAHNISFDTQFIPFLKSKKQFCTMITNMDIVAVEFFEGKNEWKWPKLSETAIYYGIQFNNNELHHSMSDTEITTKIFQKMIEVASVNENKSEMIFVSSDYTGFIENTEKYYIDALINTEGNKRSEEKAMELIRATKILGSIKSAGAIESLIELALKDNEYWARWNAVEALGNTGDLRAIEPLISALSDKTLTVRKNAVNALKKFKEPMAISAVRNYEDANRDKKNGTMKQSQNNLHEKRTKTEVNNSSAPEYNENNFDHLHKTESQYWNDSMTRLTIIINHVGLGISRAIRDDEELVYKKVAEQFRKWDEQYLKIIQRKKSHTDKEASLNIAEERTRDAKEKLKQIDDLLVYAIGIDNTVTWQSLKDTKKFNIPNPKYNSEGNLRDIYEIPSPTPPTFKELPIEPDIRLYKPDISFIDNIFESKKAKKIEQAEARYQENMAAWKKSVDEININNIGIKEQFEHKLKEYEDKKLAIKNRYDELEEAWENSKELYYNKQTKYNEKIDKLKDSYFNKNTGAVIEYCEIVLNNSKYPDTFPKDIKIDYDPNTRTMIIEYLLPAPVDLPSLKEVKYISSSKELKESYLSDSQISKTYDSTIYKITLRTLHELFEADKAEALDNIIFNGWVNSISKATGKNVNTCIVTIRVKKAEFSQIELKNIDPKICFYSLKGVGVDKLCRLSAVKPIVQINKNKECFAPSN